MWRYASRKSSQPSVGAVFVLMSALEQSHMTTWAQWEKTLGGILLHFCTLLWRRPSHLCNSPYHG